MKPIRTLIWFLRLRVGFFLSYVHHSVSVGRKEISRGKDIELMGFKPFDALHLACAESGNADVFLTTDDRLIKRSKRFISELRVRVENPLTWLLEVIENEHINNDRQRNS